MARGPGHSARSVATAALASALMAVLAASGGCEVMVGRDVPAFACDQGPDVCPDNEVCDVSTHQCVVRCDLIGCKDGLQCDPGTHLCTTGVVASDGGDGATKADGNDAAMAGDDADASMRDQVSPPDTGMDSSACRGVGCPCSGPSDCDSRICADTSTVPSALYSAAGHSFCTRPCCTSADCDSGSVCFADSSASTGGNYCVLPAWLGRSTILGGNPGGASCGSGSDCRSGLCAGSACADTCCSTNGSSTECGGGTECRFASFPGATGFDKGYVASCGSGGSGQNGSSCNGNSDCQSELCDSNFNGTCRNACRNTADCGGGSVSCAYVSTMGNNAVIAACFPGGGNASEGQSCSSDGQCQSQFCDPVARECTDVCFTDADCTKPGWRCRPEQVTLQAGGSYTVLACGS